VIKINDEIKEGSILVLKKGHPCGENKWQIISFGTICKIKCLGCDRVILIDRVDLKKKIKKVLQ
jgi:hypothetical protein